MSTPLLDFIVACLVMGLGIGTDVAIATVLRAKQLSSFRIALFWIIGVSLTHTLFPMVGYLLTYFSIQTLPTITPIVGILAFSCIAHFIWSELADYADPSTENDGQDDRQLLISLGLILAVSWDALWSGPAKSAQVIGWPDLMVWGSFLIVGLMVSVAALVSWGLGKYLQQKQTRSAEHPNPVALWLQYSVISYFGWLALLRYTLDLNVAWWHVLLLSSAIVALVMTALRPQSNEITT